MILILRQPEERPEHFECLRNIIKIYWQLFRCKLINCGLCNLLISYTNEKYSDGLFWESPLFHKSCLNGFLHLIVNGCHLKLPITFQITYYINLNLNIKYVYHIFVFVDRSNLSIFGVLFTPKFILVVFAAWIALLRYNCSWSVNNSQLEKEFKLLRFNFASSSSSVNSKMTEGTFKDVEWEYATQCTAISNSRIGRFALGYTYYKSSFDNHIKIK